MLSYFKPFFGNTEHDCNTYIKQQEQYHKNQLKKLEKMKKIEYKPLKLPTNSNSYYYSSNMISNGNTWKLNRPYPREPRRSKLSAKSLTDSPESSISDT